MSSSMPLTRRQVLLFVCVLFAGFVLRAGAAAFTVVDKPIRADAAQYYAYAFNLVETGTYSMELPGITAHPRPDATRPPGYALALAPFAALWPQPEAFLTAVLWAQALAGMLTIWLSFVLARRLMPVPVALLVAALVALSPHLVSMGTYLLTETLFTLLLVAGLCAATIALDSGRTRDAVLAGALLGAAAMTRATLNYLPVLLLALLLSPGLRRRHGRCLAIVALGMALPLLLWGLRNLLVLGQWSDPTLAINMLHHGMYPDFMYRNDPASYGMPHRHDPESARISSGTGAFLSVLLERMRAEPATYLSWYLFGKLDTFLQWSIVAGQGDVFVYPVIYSPYYDNPNFIATHVAMHLLHAPLMWLGSARAMVLCMRMVRGRVVSASEWLLAVIVMYFLLLHMIGAPFPRYRIPLQPVLYLLALQGLLAAWSWVRFRRQSQPVLQP